MNVVIFIFISHCILSMHKTLKSNRIYAYFEIHFCTKNFYRLVAIRNSIVLDMNKVSLLL